MPPAKCSRWRRWLRAGLLPLLLLLPAAVQGARAAAAPDTIASPARLADAASPVLGNPRGRDIIVEFFDYRCPYCRRMQATFDRLLAQDSEARLVLKEWPVFGGVSVYAARVALASRWQGRFAAVHEGLFKASGPLDRAAVRRIARDAGVDLPRLDRDLHARRAELDGMLRQVAAQAAALGFQGTPGLVIGRHPISGALSLADLRNLLASAR